MGQRHQAFVIAKIVPHGSDSKAYYRCIAAWHHQWCYGRLPLHATRRFVSLAKQKENAERISYEVACLNGKYARFGEEPDIPDVPASFVSFLLAQAFNIDFASEPAYFHGGAFDGGSMLPASMGSGEGDNNDGITVIDVTDPFNPHYCFVSVWGLEAHNSVRRRTPLSAEKYARAYYPKGSEEDAVEEDVIKTIASLDDTALVTPQMLHEAWPSEYKAKTVPVSSEVSSNVDADATGIPSLSDLSLSGVVDVSLENADATHLVNLLEEMPHKAPSLKALLKGKPFIPDELIPVLAKIFAVADDPSVVDLSGWALSGKCVDSLVSQMKDIRDLTLSGNSEVTIDTVRDILSSQSGIRRLSLLNTGVSSKTLAALIAEQPELFYSIENLVHPYLFEIQSDDVEYTSAFTYTSPASRRMMMYGGNNLASIPLLHPGQVVQALTDGLRLFATEQPSYSGPNSTTFFPQVAFGTGIRLPERSWSERPVLYLPNTDCKAGATGEGWMFVFLPIDPMDFMPSGRQRTTTGYAFVKVNQDALVALFQRLQAALDAKKAGKEPELTSSVADTTPAAGAAHLILDLKQFLQAMKDEGRPSPSVEAVTALEDILQKLKDSQTGLELLTATELDNVLPSLV